MMWIYIAVSVSLFVAFTNLIVLALICSFRRLQTLRNVPLAGLATADILVGLFWIPLATASSYLPDNKGLCRAALSCEILTMHASLFNLIAVSTERWIAIFKPLHYHQIASRTVVISSIAVSWVLSFAMLLAFLLADKHDNDITECDIVKYTDKWLLYMILIIFYIVCGLMILMQLKVYIVVRDQLRKIRPLPKPGNVTNGLIAATSFIIEKSFNIDNSSENNENDEESKAGSTDILSRSGELDEVERLGKYKGFDREVKEHDAVTMAEQNKLRTVSNIRMKTTTLTIKKEALADGENLSNGLGAEDTRPSHIDHGTGSSMTEIKSGLKVCIEKQNTSTNEKRTLVRKVEINNAFMSNSTCIDENVETKSASDKSSTQHIAQIVIIENESMKQNEVHWQEQYEAKTTQCTGKLSSRERAYFSPDQEHARQKGTGTKKSFASFAKMFSVIKKQKKSDVARAIATNVVCLCFVLMWAPKSTVDLLTGLGYCDSCSLAHSISAVLAWTNSGINALIYAWRMQEFRQAMRGILIKRSRRAANRAT